MRHIIASVIVCAQVALMFTGTRLAHAQTLQVLHAFTGGADGALPAASLTFDGRGNLYGTAIYGGNTGRNCHGTGSGCGTVFKLTHTGSGWILTPLYTFSGGDDGMNPTTNVVFGPGGLLYGTTNAGGGNGCGGTGCGTVFSLRPPSHACTSALCPWTEIIIHRFSGSDGQSPSSGVIFDANGNLYGMTGFGGAYSYGTVFELTPIPGGGWTEQVLHNFQNNGADGLLPSGGLTFDVAGNLYGTTYQGGDTNYGTVFELTPTQDGGWTEQVLYSFYQGNDGYQPVAGLIFDAAGNLYGTTPVSGFPVEQTGLVFDLMPTDGGWTEQVLYRFQNNGSDGKLPAAGLIFDSAGNLFGTTAGGGGPSNYGTVFELTPSQGGGWTEQVLHRFIGSDGASPQASLVLDSAGNLYSTTRAGGAYNAGTVFELTPSGETKVRSPKCLYLWRCGTRQ